MRTDASAPDAAIGSLAHLLGVSGDLATSVTGIQVDSRLVRPGDLFVALKGGQVDGRDYIGAAIKAGAVAVLSTPDAAPMAKGVTFVADPDPRRRYALMAARLFPHQPRVQVAVTGTNGKTSVVEFTRQIWAGLSKKAASFGTLGLKGDGVSHAAGLTSPEPAALHAALNSAADAGVSHLALEASSHGIEQRRLDGVTLCAAAFTNLTRDHLDYHQTFEAYYSAKARLFTDLLPTDGTAVVMIDSAYGRRLADYCDGRGLRTIRVGRSEAATLRLLSQQPTATGQEIRVSFEGSEASCHLPLIGAFQADNALTALGLVLASGADFAPAWRTIKGLTGVPGRMELVGVSARGGLIFIDYAHTPGGLETLLEAARGHQPRSLYVVFGCGGDRDTGKRAEMGAVAARLADRVIITDDNPRSEDPADIRRAVRAAAPQATEIGDRAQAIAAAIKDLEDGDMLIIAGKGHEEGQIIGDQIIPFSDRNVVQTELLQTGMREAEA